MSRISMIATALIVGLLAGSAANARANSKQKNDQKEKAHKIVGLSPVDFPHKGHGDKDGKDHDHHGKDHRNGKDHCGKDQCNSNDPCKNGSKPPKENMGGSSYSPPGTPGNPVMPSKPTLPTTPIKYYGINNNLVSSQLKQQKGSNTTTGPKPGKLPIPGQGPVQGKIPNIGTGWMGAELAVGEAEWWIGSTINHAATEVSNAWGSVTTGVYNGVSGLVSDAGSILGDIF